MKKIILALVLALIASPAWAAVVITATDVGDCKAQIAFDASGEAQLVRAFALDITVTGANIVEVNDFKVGVSMAASKGFGIFPANFSRFITVNTDGTVTDWEPAGYTPVADEADPGAAGPLGGPAITIEMGSLYDGDANKPATSGVLCTVKVDGDCTLSVTLNAMRGNVVLENAAEATVDLTGATGVSVACGDVCFPAAYSTYNDWVTMGSPDCWCGPPKGNGYQCDGDADGNTQGVLKERVMTNDLAVLIANWKKKIADPTLNPCADLDHKGQGVLKERVMTNDLNILIANWKKKDAQLPGDCPRPE
jgi:hypothetical protein